MIYTHVLRKVCGKFPNLRYTSTSIKVGKSNMYYTTKVVTINGLCDLLFIMLSAKNKP